VKVIVIFVATVLVNLGAMFCYTSLASAWPSIHPRGVTVYKPEQCASGYLLEFYRRRIPMLMDMNGNVVHTWKNVRGIGRMQLLPNGNLVVINRGTADDRSDLLPPGEDEPELVIVGEEASILEVDWDGNKVWEYKPPSRPHHDFKRLENGNTIMIHAEQVPEEYKAAIDDPKRHAAPIKADCILEVNMKGETVWEWHEYEHLDINHYSKTDGLADWTHTNTVQVLPPNHWYDEGDGRFKPGNVLISVRNQNTIYIIDRGSKEIVWSYTGNYKGGLAHQHEPHMIEPDLPGAGNILIFDNGIGCRSIAHEGRTYILEINPATKKIVWKYEKGHRFYSATAGVQQRLMNGNTLITSSCGGRVFEVTPRGQTVWEWTPVFSPMRPNRYSYDFCPQLKQMGKPKETPVDLSKAMPGIVGEASR
jgi:hypothetical protein